MVQEHSRKKQAHPSISKKLLTDALNFAKSKVTIIKKEINMFSMHANLSYSTKTKLGWKREENVTMSAFDGSEICELVGISCNIKSATTTT